MFIDCVWNQTSNLPSYIAFNVVELVHYIKRLLPKKSTQSYYICSKLRTGKVLKMLYITLRLEMNNYYFIYYII